MCNEYDLTSPMLQMSTGKDDTYGACPNCDGPMSVGEHEEAGECIACQYDLHGHKKKRADAASAMLDRAIKELEIPLFNPARRGRDSKYVPHIQDALMLLRSLRSLNQGDSK